MRDGIVVMEGKNFIGGLWRAGWTLGSWVVNVNLDSDVINISILLSRVFTLYPNLLRHVKALIFAGVIFCLLIIHIL